MKTDIGKLSGMMMVGLVVMLAGVRIGAAEGEKAADPFVKGIRPAVLDSKVPGGGDERQLEIERLKAIIIPALEFNQVNIENAIEHLVKLSIARDPNKVGVTVVSKLQGAQPMTVTCSLKEVSLFDALEHITKAAGLKFEIKGNILIIGLDDAVSGKMPTSSYPIEVEVQYIAFGLGDVEKLLIEDKLNGNTLTELWKKGSGHLLAAPRVVTQSGQETNIKGITEFLYPTDFEAADVSHRDTLKSNVAWSTNTADTVHSAIMQPGEFTSQDVGVKLDVIPILNVENGMIQLSMNPNMVEDPEWRDYGSTYRDSNGREQQVRMEQPLFHMYNLNCQVSLQNGHRLLIGGGMPSADHKQLVYVFVTARELRD